MTNARDAALFVLDRKDLPGWMATCPSAQVQPRASRRPGRPAQSRVAEQIEVGVVKNLLQLQFLVEAIADRPLAKVHPLLQKILAIAIYQLRFLDRVPPRRRLMKEWSRQSASVWGTPAVLPTRFYERPPPPARTLCPRSRTPSKGRGSTTRIRPSYFIGWLRLLARSRALAICMHDNAEPPLIGRLCDGRSLADAIEIDAQAVAHGQTGMVVLTDASKGTLARLSQSGVAQVQDATSASVVRAAAIGSGMSVLDRCCGMGTKTLQAYESAGGDAAIVAIDPSAARCDALRKMLDRAADHQRPGDPVEFVPSRQC